MAYLFKPSADLTDRIASVVRDAKLEDPLLPLSIASFYEYSARRLLQEYQHDPGLVLHDLREYLTTHKNGNK